MVHRFQIVQYTEQAPILSIVDQLDLVACMSDPLKRDAHGCMEVQKSKKEWREERHADE